MKYLSIPHYIGLKEKYNEALHGDGLYFATDTFEIIARGKVYGSGTTIKSGSFEGTILTLSTSNGNIEIEFPLATTEIDGLITAEDKTNLDACVETKLSASEKSWVEDQLFNTLFTASISASPSSSVFSGKDITVTYTLTTKYDSTNVDLDSVPSGWTKSSTGVYTKTGTITSSTGSSINSGSVTCTYNKRSKTASAASSSNIKYSYILTSTASSLTTSDLDTIATSGTQISTNNTITGDKTINITTDKSYVYFVIANTSTLKNVQQLGLDYLENKTGTSLVRTGYGTYKVYRSANSMAVGTQTVTIS